MIYSNTWNYSTYVYKSYISNMYKPDLALNNLQSLICYKIKPNQTTVYKLFALDKNTWYHIIELLVWIVVTWSYNCLQVIINSYLKQFNCVQAIG